MIGQPGLNPYRLARKIIETIKDHNLDLSKKIVLTEAATGSYVVTPVIAAFSGADHVFAVTKTTRCGTVQDVRQITEQLSRIMNIHKKITIVENLTPEIINQADIVTNSGHLRPIDIEFIKKMKKTAVIPLMMEAWEFRKQDLDIGSCRINNIAVAGTNERHSKIKVFNYLGIMAAKLLLDVGIPLYGSKVNLLCDNPFREYIEHSLTCLGSFVTSFERFQDIKEFGNCDAFLVALKPQEKPVISLNEINVLKKNTSGTVVVQFWGDIDRERLDIEKISYWPINTPKPGHMGILPSSIGPDPVILLQCGSLKVAEIMSNLRLKGITTKKVEEFVEKEGWGQQIE